MKTFIDNLINEDGSEKGRIFIESSSLGFHVVLYSGKTRIDAKTGAEIEISETLADFVTIASCVKYILNHIMIKRSEAKTLHELIQDVQRIEKYIQDKINF